MLYVCWEWGHAEVREKGVQIGGSLARETTLEGRRWNQKQDVRKPEARNQDCFCLFVWPGMNYLDQDALEFVEICLPLCFSSVGILGPQIHLPFCCNSCIGMGEYTGIAFIGIIIFKHCGIEYIHIFLQQTPPSISGTFPVPQLKLCSQFNSTPLLLPLPALLG